ncbi:MAG: hypothetical protein K2I96_25320 [Lachnospiraceae bacterium]|nr:hypothetical protein [Lachnospiraceae bacterium]
MFKILLQLGMLIIPPIVVLFIWNKNKNCQLLGRSRIRRFIVCFLGINILVYLISYFRGVRAFSFHNMTYSYCIKWLLVGMGFAVCGILFLQYIWRCVSIMGRTGKVITVLLMQATVVSVCILLLCCREYRCMDVTRQMIGGEHTYMDDIGRWCIDEQSGYASKDVILSGPYIFLEKGSYTVTVEYDSDEAQFFQVISEQHSVNLESESAVFLGGGRQQRKANIRINGELDDLDIQVRYSGKGNIRIAHIWIQQNHAVHIEYILIIAILFLIWDLWEYLYEIKKIRNPAKESVKMLCSAFLSTIAVSVSGRVVCDGTFFHLLREETSGRSIALLIVGVAVFAFYRRCQITKKECTNEIKGLAVVFTICMIVGTSISANGNLKFLLNSPMQFFLCALVSAGYYILFRNVLYWLFGKMDTVLGKREVNGAEENTTMHSVLKTLIVLAVFWIPIWICFWPGSIAWDGMTQINMALGIWDMTNHHPWLSTLFMKTFLKIGMCFSDNMGVFVLVLGNEIIELIIYAYVCVTIKKICGMIPYIVTVLFYCLHPIFSMFGQLVMKDGLYAAVFALYMAMYVKCMWESQRRKGITCRQFLVLAVIGTVVCTLRKNGVYVIFPSYMGLLLVRLSPGKKTFVIALGFLIMSCFVLVDRILPVRLGITQGSAREMLSIPFQQTARCFRDHGSYITEEEYEAVGRVLDARRLKELYNPELSDPVKNTYRVDSTPEDLGEYFEIWTQMFWKYPVSYVEATLQNSYGYYYPFENFRGKQNDYITINNNPMTGDFDPHYLFSYELRNKIGEYIFSWKNVPILSLFMNTGSYTWLLFVAAGYTIHHKRFRELAVYIAPFMNVLICIASPVNGEIRYALPLMAVTPLWVCWCCLGYSKRYGVESVSHTAVF